MKRFKTSVVLSLFVLFQIASIPQASAGVPLTNLEGVGGIALNPVAYLAGSSVKTKKENQGTFKGKAENVLEKYGVRLPQIGSWYVHFGASKIDWATVGVADSFFNRLEISYGFETASIGSTSHKYKNNIGTKLLLIEENWNDYKFVPAVSIGGIWKNTVNAGSRENGYDGYLVASKLITQLPRPLLISGGALLTQGQATGLLGYNKESDVTLFGNTALMLTNWLAVGYEVKQGAKFKDFKNATYQDAHIAWMPNRNLSVVAAYVYGGAIKKPTVGLGDGVVISLQYAF